MKSDIERAARGYEEQRAGLGDDLVAAVDWTFQTIRLRPLQYQQLYGQVRRALTHRFPYAVFYLVNDDATIVLAVLHQATDPARWPSVR